MYTYIYSEDSEASEQKHENWCLDVTQTCNRPMHCDTGAEIRKDTALDHAVIKQES